MGVDLLYGGQVRVAEGGGTLFVPVQLGTKAFTTFACLAMGGDSAPPLGLCFVAGAAPGGMGADEPARRRAFLSVTGTASVMWAETVRGPFCL
jgi:hypothetical protein